MKKGYQESGRVDESMDGCLVEGILTEAEKTGQVQEIDFRRMQGGVNGREENGRETGRRQGGATGPLHDLWEDTGRQNEPAAPGPPSASSNVRQLQRSLFLVTVGQ